MSVELLQGYTERIKRYEKDIQHNYIQIAMNLYEIQEFELIKDTEYKNIYDYALIEFGFEKSKTNELINIYKKFFFEERKAKKGILTYGEYSITQLKYMLNMSEEQLKQCDHKLSVRAIKLIRINSSTRVNNEDIANTEKLENKTVITGVFPGKKEEEKQSTLIVSQLPTPDAAVTETRTIVTETITTQNNDFVPNQYETYKEKYELNCKESLKLNIEIQELKHEIETYKEIINYISESLINCKSFVTDNHIVNLNHEISIFLKNGNLPKKVQFMQNVI